MPSSEIIERAKRVKALIVDIDGVMTDGRIIYSVHGDELKLFDVQDGFGIMLLNTAGIKTFIITAKESRIVRLRSRDLKVTKAYHGFSDKLIPFNKILRQYKILAEEVCFVGDDLVDLPVLKRVGFSVAVPNAVEEVKAVSHYITSKTGGRGAVREICDMILKTQNKWDLTTSSYYR